MDLVSIIIPTYNCEKYILQAIDSALVQTYANCEVIVVDDGSTDNTLKLIKDKYINKSTNHPLLLLHKPNGGTASALNLGISKCHGEWVKWLSADDVLYPNAVEVLMTAAISHPDGEDCIFYTPYDYIDSDGNITGQFKEPDYNQTPKEQVDTLLLDHFIGNGSSSLIHKRIFDRIGLFDSNLGVCEDYEFWLRACLLDGCRLWLVNQIILQYRIHENQLTKQWNVKAHPIINKIRDDIRKKYEQGEHFTRHSVTSG